MLGGWHGEGELRTQRASWQMVTANTFLLYVELPSGSVSPCWESDTLLLFDSFPLPLRLWLQLSLLL